MTCQEGIPIEKKQLFWKGALVLLLVCMLAGCAEEKAAAAAGAQAPERQVVVYYPGGYLNLFRKTPNSEVFSLPWDRVTCVNYAFWEVEPAQKPKQTSLERKKAGLKARTSFRITSGSKVDLLNRFLISGINPKYSQDAFSQFRAMAEKYPDVKIMISIGGWNRCGFFSEMAYTPEGRASFIQSCVELIQDNPWIGGFDLDWEYPAVHSRAPNPENPDDQGCPIFGTKEQDRENFTKLIQEFRKALDDAFGEGEKWLTACACGSPDYALPFQDWAEVSESLNLINLMTYDLANADAGFTQHASSLAGTVYAARYLLDLGIPSRKICIGSPLYGTGFEMTNPQNLGLSASALTGHSKYHHIPLHELLPLLENPASGYALEQKEGRWIMGEAFDRGTTGFHLAFDARKGGAYAYCDDPKSPYYMQFFSYENPLSLQFKTDTIQKLNLGGIIVWESTMDTSEYAMITQMYESLKN